MWQFLLLVQSKHPIDSYFSYDLRDGRRIEQMNVSSPPLELFRLGMKTIVIDDANTEAL